MRIRLIGTFDIVRGWSRRLQALGFVGQEYEARGAGQLRWYGEIDDRIAARMDPRQEPLDFDMVSNNGDKKKRARKVKVSAAETQADGLAPTLPAPPPRKLGRGKR